MKFKEVIKFILSYEIKPRVWFKLVLEHDDEKLFIIYKY